MIQRRKRNLSLSIATSVFSLFISGSITEIACQPAVFPKLPYAENALEPAISARTISFHYGKHHKTYVDNCNKLVQGTTLEKMSLEQIILTTAGKPDQMSVFNNAAQSWNHSFYWQSLRPASDATIPDTIKAMIDKSFGSIDTFKSVFAQTAVSQFGSGWAWLVKEGDKLKVIKTTNAENPLPLGLIPLLTIDVWEHAYYLDYQNKRADHVKTLINKMLNWDFAVKNLSTKLPTKADTK
ncbi:MAG TPA: superoxide dismutase [Chitinispirillaceae bacterium]|nr:superoxide dismutase [Chitinispirillaceae bacterium]